jgi:hypothetical protein
MACNKHGTDAELLRVENQDRTVASRVPIEQRRLHHFVPFLLIVDMALVVP